MYQENVINQWKKDPSLAITAVLKVTYLEIVINLSNKIAEEEEDEVWAEVEVDLEEEETPEEGRLLVTIATVKVIWPEIALNHLLNNNKSTWNQIQWIAMVKKNLMKEGIRIKAYTPIQTSNKLEKPNTVLYLNHKENLIFKEMHLNNKNQLTLVAT